MSLNEIVLGENKALIPEIIGGIQDIAIRLNQNNDSLKRKALVRELNELIPELNLSDGLIVKSLVREAYLQANTPVIKNAISERFFENSGNDLVYNPYRISTASINLTVSDHDTLGLNEFFEKTETLNKNIQKLGKTNSVAEIYETKNAIDLYEPEDNFSLTGRTKVDDTLKYAKKIFGGYQNLINQYEFAKQKNLDLIQDFELLREELLNFKTEIAQLLFDIIGNDKKESHPELFDFSEIEYFDYEKFRGKVHLAFEDIDSNLVIFKKTYDGNMDKIKQAGINHADHALERYSKTYKRNGYVSKREVKGQVAVAALGFAFDAALNIIDSRKSAEETVALINRDIQQAKLNLKDDTQKIALDLLRLSKIHNRLKVSLIPEAKRFIENASIIFNSTVKDIYSELVKGGSIEKLSDENRKLVAEKKQIDLEIEDKKSGIEICENEITYYKELISETQFEYVFVNSIKPSIPNSFHNIISFGIAKNTYVEHLAEWEKITSPVRISYESYVNSMNIEEKNVEMYKDIIPKLENRLEEIEKQRENNKLEIEAQRIKIEDFEPQLEILENKINQISVASKNLLERRIDKHLVKMSDSNNSNKASSMDDIFDTNSPSISSLSDDDNLFLSNERCKMHLKVKLIEYVETLSKGDLAGKLTNLGGEKLEILISDQINKIKPYLNDKINENTRLNPKQAAMLVDLGTDIFFSILKTQKIKTHTNFLENLNDRLDQEFLKHFESSVASLRLSLEKDQDDANMTEFALNEAMSAEDLLKASELIRNNN